MLVFSLNPVLSTLGVLGLAIALAIVALVMFPTHPVLLTDEAEHNGRKLTRRLRLRLWWRQEQDTVVTGVMVIGWSVLVFLASVQLLAWMIQAYL